jgi:hypothetical protein
MLLRLAVLGGLGYAAYNYYTKNREEVDGALRKLTQGGDETGATQSGEGAELAGGPLSSEARVVHAGEGPLAAGA